MSILPSNALAARSLAVSTDPDQVVFYVRAYYLQKYVAVAMLMLIIYNAMMTFDKEVEFFWIKQRSVNQCIFFLNRLIGLVGGICHVSDESFGLSRDASEANWSGRFSQWTAAICAQTTILLIDYILLIRVLALYSENKIITAFLRLAFALESASFIALTVYTYVFQELAVREIVPGMTICNSKRLPPPKLSPPIWAIPLIFAVMLMGLALCKAASTWRETQGFKGVVLIKVLIQDQVLYFLLAIYCSVANFIASSTGFDSDFSYVLAASGNSALLCVMGSHLLIHFKEAAEEGIGRRMCALSTMELGLDSEESKSTVADKDGFEINSA